MKVKSLSRVQLLAIPRTAAYQGSSVRGIFQARVLELGAIAFYSSITEPPAKKEKKRATGKQMEKKIYVTAYLNLLSLVHFKII